VRRMVLKIAVNQIWFIPHNVLLIICTQQHMNIMRLTTCSTYTWHSPAGFEDKSSDSGRGQYNGRYNTAHQSNVYYTDTSETYNSSYDNNVDGMARRILKLYWYKFTCH